MGRLDKRGVGPLPATLDAEHLAARLYDAFQPDGQAEVAQWVRWAARAVAACSVAAADADGFGMPLGKVLVVPARTGELAAGLARQGYRVSGVDSAAAMLREGARRYLDAEAGPGAAPLELVPAELSRLQLQHTFDFIAVPRDGLSLQEGATAIRNTAARLLAHLRPGGTIIAQVHLPPPADTPRGMFRSVPAHGPLRAHLLPAGWQAVRSLEEWWDGKQRLRRVNIFEVSADTGTAAVEVRWVEELCCPNIAELSGILADVGFDQVATMTGAWPRAEGGPADEGHHYTVITGRRGTDADATAGSVTDTGAAAGPATGTSAAGGQHGNQPTDRQAGAGPDSP